MPWKERTAMLERKSFVGKAQQVGANISQLCHAYGISRTTGYKWLRRFDAEGEQGLQEQSRRPHHSPNKTTEEIIEGITQPHAPL